MKTATICTAIVSLILTIALFIAVAGAVKARVDSISTALVQKHAR